MDIVQIKNHLYYGHALPYQQMVCLVIDAVKMKLRKAAAQVVHQVVVVYVVESTMNLVKQLLGDTSVQVLTEYL